MATFPIAETFWSLQGEGTFTGTPMLFIRLAGCNVGRYPAQQSDLGLRILSRHSTCCTVDGQEFVCDTDYHRTEDLTLSQLISLVEQYSIPIQRVCLTGGEPFLHSSLWGLVEALEGIGVISHIETSGTCPISWPGTFCWITCSPKRGYLADNDDYIDEFKLLVGEQTRLKDLERWAEEHAVASQVFLQPIGEISSIRQDNLKRCLEMLQKHPNWRLSAQLHKFLGER